MTPRHQREQAEIKAAAAAKKAAGLTYTSNRAERDWVRLREQIPAENRDLTSRLMGDPLIGRRALDMRHDPH